MIEEYARRDDFRNFLMSGECAEMGQVVAAITQ
jgi:hypothetical protein